MLSLHLRNMSVVCSLLTTCKTHDINPREYLNDVIARMPYHKMATHEELLNLLPHNGIETFGKCIDKTKGRIWQIVLTATYRFNKIIATATIGL